MLTRDNKKNVCCEIINSPPRVERSELYVCAHAVIIYITLLYILVITNCAAVLGIKINYINF